MKNESKKSASDNSSTGRTGAPADKSKNIFETLKRALSREEIELVDELFKEKERRLRESLRKIPIIFALLGTLGLVSVFYGFEKIIDQSFLANQPLYLILFGIILLLLTGLFYEKL